MSAQFADPASNPASILLESSGDNLVVDLRTGLSALTICLIDAAGGEKVSCSGPSIACSDLFLINKTSFAHYVGPTLDVMARDAKTMRGHLSSRICALAMALPKQQ